MAKLELDVKDSGSKKYIICEVSFNGKYIKYYPEMFINICQNFLTADLQLRKDIEVLLSISKKLKGDKKKETDKNEDDTFINKTKKI